MIVLPVILGSCSFLLGHLICKDYLADQDKLTEDEQYSALFEEIGIMNCAKDWIKFKKKEDCKGYYVLYFEISNTLDTKNFKEHQKTLAEKLDASYVRIEYQEDELLIYVQKRCEFLTPHSLNYLFRNLNILTTNDDWTELILYEEKDAYMYYCFKISDSLCLKDFQDKKSKLQEKLESPLVELKYEKGILMMKVQKTIVPTRDYEPMQVQGNQCLLGHDLDYNPVFWDLSKIPNLAIVGMTGVGKSTIINTLIINSLLAQNVEFDLIDLKGGAEFFDYRNKEGVLHFCENLDQAEKAIQDFKEEFERRRKLLRTGEKQYRTYEKYIEEHPDCNLKRRVLIIDEWLVFANQENQKFKYNGGKKGQSPVLMDICNLAAQVRFVGMNILISMQRASATILDGDIKANFNLIGMHVINKINADIVGIEGLEDLEHYALMGEFDSEIKKVKAYFLDEDMIYDYISQIKNRIQEEAPTEQAPEEVAKEQQLAQQTQRAKMKKIENNRSTLKAVK